MSTAEELRRKIRRFKDVIESSESSTNVASTADTLKEIASSIIDDCKRFTPTESTFVAEVLFGNNDNSLLSIIENALPKYEYSKAIDGCTGAFVVTVWKLDVPQVETYSVSLWNLAKRICRNENLKADRGAGFNLLIAIMDSLKLSEKRDSLNAMDLVRWCWRQVDHIDKLNSTIKKGLFQLMGALCKYYPECMLDDNGKKNYSVTFATVMAMELKKQMTSSKSPVMSVIEGCFSGLNGLLCNFADVFDAGTCRVALRDLYDYAKSAANPDVQVSRLGPTKAALDLLATHGSLFKEYFYQEYRQIYGNFRRLAVHNNRDVKYAGLSAVEAFIKQISMELLSNVDMHRSEAETVYKYFVDEFRKTLISGNSTRELAMSAKGYGQFAAACKALYGQEHLGVMFIDLSSRCEELFLSSSDPLEQKVTYIPMFLEAFSMMLNVVEQPPADVWISVETLHILLFQQFPLLDPKYHQRCIGVSYGLFHAALPFSEHYIDKIVYQSLLRLCSLPPASLIALEETDEDSLAQLVNFERDPRKLTYRAYLPLWRQLLNIDSFKGMESFGVEAGPKQAICKTVGEAFFKATVDVLDKLDFNVIRRMPVEQTDQSQSINDQNLAISSDPVLNVQPQKASDIRLLVNLADFSRDLLSNMVIPVFSEWMFPFLSRLMDLATRYPLISGFYKLLTLCLNVGNKMKLLEVGFAAFDSSNSFELFSRFVDEVSMRMKNFKDDLFISCLELVLSLPSNLVVAKMDVLADVIKSSLRLGISYLPLAEACLNALERWSADENCLNELTPLYVAVLPSFDEYLRSEGIDEDGNGLGFLSPTKTTRKRMTNKREVMTRKAQMKASLARKSVDTARLNELRVRMLLFVGKLGGEINRHLIDQSAEEIAKKSVAWDTEQRLEFRIPFLDMKPSIMFDSFLPRICELATGCGNRQTKIAACELLHSVILLLIGKAASRRDIVGIEGEMKRSPFHKLYRHVFPVMLQLCCDPDEVPKQLFRTLVTETIHWFTSNRSSDNPETVALLDTFMDGVISHDANLRDYCAECLNEFLEWSIKHSPRDSTMVNSNFRSLMRKMYSFASHPASTKTLGAALVFNSIYRTFREEERLVDIYTFDIFAVFTNALSRAHNDDAGDEGGVIDQLINVSKHLDRIIHVKKSLFNTASTRRKKPLGWTGVTLSDCVIWLFNQIGRHQTQFRQRCFDLLDSWAPLVDGDTSLKSLASKFTSQDNSRLFRLFENDGMKESLGGIRKCPTVKMGSVSILDLCHWLNCLEAALDCYQICLDQSIITVRDIFDIKNHANIMTSLGCFFEDVMNSEDTNLTILTPLERRTVNRAKCSVIIRAIMFIKTILPARKINDIPFLTNFWRLLICCVFRPSEVGFDMTVKETSDQLPKLLHCILLAIKNFPSDLSVGFYHELERACKNEYQIPSLDRLLNERQASWVALNELLRGYEIAVQASVLSSTQFPSSEKLWQDVANASFIQQATGDITPRSWPANALLAVRNILKTAAVVGVKMDVIISLLLDSTPVASYRRVNRLTGKGQFLLGMFHSQLAELAARHPKAFATALLSDLRDRSQEGISQIGDVLLKMTDSITRTRQLRTESGVEFVEQVTARGKEIFERMCDGTEAVKILLVRFIQKLLLIDTRFLSTVGQYLFDIFIKLLTSRNGDLRFKNKVLTLLGAFAAYSYFDVKLKEALNSFVVSSFPFRSTEFSKGSRDYDEYITSLRRLTKALEMSDNTIILDTLMRVLSREKEHVAEVEIGSALAAYCRNLTPLKSEAIIVVPLNFFFNDDSDINAEHRLNSLSKFLLPMLNGFTEKMLSKFYLDKGFRLVMEKLDVPLSNTQDNVYKNQIATRVGCFRLLELMYNRLDAEILKGVINDLFVGKSGGDKAALTKHLIVTAVAARNEGEGQATLMELKHAYRCSAHNLLIAVISKTQTRALFFEKYIFSDAWNSIMNQSKNYVFDVELENYPGWKRQLQNLQGFRLENGDSLDSQRRTRTGMATLHFLESQQSLNESSMRSDVSEYDFTNSSIGMSRAVEAVVSMTSSQDSLDSQSQSQLSTVAPTNGTEPLSRMGIDLEADELNLHPCMEAMVAVIRTLTEKITPLTEGVMPEWMKLMLQTLKSNVNINVKLFIARMVTVLDELFIPFGQVWLQPLTDLCLNPSFGKSGLNYFRVDIIAAMLRWSKTAGPSRVGDSKLSDLFQYCMVHTPNGNRQVVKRNLRLLNLMLEAWKDHIRVDPKLITDQLKKCLKKHEVHESSKAEPDNLGIQLMGVVLANKVDPANGNVEAAKELYRTLALCLKENSAKIYKPAAEVAGLALAYLKEKSMDYVGEVEHLLTSEMRGVALDRAKFLNCLVALQRHYPEFADSFLRDVLAWLPSVHGDFKTHSLEILCSRAEIIPRLYEEMRARGFANFLTISDERNQTWAVKILCKVVNNLSVDDLGELLPLLMQLVGHSSVECRRATADFLIRVYDMRSASANMTKPEKAIVETSKEALLTFLNDSEPGIKLLVYNFWSHDSRLSKDTVGRLMNILNQTYTEATEKDFLGHATYLLLELTSRSPDYKRPIFDAPLQECRFDNLLVTTSWKRRYATFQTPAFADSIMGSQQATLSPTKSAQGVRATIVDTPQFSLTMAPGAAPGGSLAVDWLTGGTYDTLAGTTGGTMETDESGLLFLSRPQRQKMSSRPADLLQRGSRLPLAPTQTDDDEDELKRLTRRVVKDKRKTASEYFARMESRRQQARQTLAEERAKSREQQVHLYRSYRMGDFPDVQIPHSAVIAPLQALAQQDAIVASLLLASLISGIYTTTNELAADERTSINSVTSSISRSINNIIAASTSHYKPLLACMQIVCYKHVDEFKFEADALCGASLLGHQQHMAIILLEKAIMLGRDDGEREAKRRRLKGSTTSERVSVNSDVVFDWTNLAKLYKSLDEHDAVRVIFGQKLPSNEITIQALEAENAGEYQKAISLYTKALREHNLDDDEMSALDSAEFTMWEESRLNCLNLLNQWDDLAAVTTRYIDDNEPPNFDKVWDDPYLQAEYFPYLFRSTLKIWSSSDENKGRAFKESLNAWIDDNEKRQWLESQHPDLMTLFAVVKREYGIAGHLCAKAIKIFLTKWTSLSVTDIVARQQYLQSLQQLVEMDDFIKLAQRDDIKNVLNFDRLLKRWEHHCPSILMDSTLTWNDVITNRRLFSEQLVQNLAKRNIALDDIYRYVLDSELRTGLLAVENALHMRNHAVAFGLLDSSKELLKADNESLGVQWAHGYVQAQHTMADRSITASKNAIPRLLSAISVLGEFQNSPTSTELKREHLLLEGFSQEKLGWLLVDAIQDKDLVQVLDNNSRKTLSKMGYDSAKPETVYNVLKDVCTLYEKAVAMEIDQGANNFKKVDGHLMLAEYCDKILRSGSDSKIPSKRHAKQYASLITQHLLMSMKNGNTRARQLFPRLIEITELYPEVGDIFIHTAADVPCWMFLYWLNQLTAILNKPFASCFRGIIERIADTYPEALVYCFGISFSGYVFENTPADKKDKAFVEKIASKMESISGIKEFLRALALFTPPKNEFNDIRDELADLFNTGAAVGQRQKVLAEFYRRLFALDYNVDELGEYWIFFRKKFKTKFDEIFGENCSKILKEEIPFSKALSKLTEFAEGTKDDSSTKDGPQVNTISEFSTWLSEYDSEQIGLHLEIPGQYTGKEKPILEHHVRISSFEPTVLTMQSIRQPRKITIRGNDGKDYAFLVKTGEDLRQDERIERLFDQMNNLFIHDSECRKKDAKVKTYGVIPLTPRIGLIEFVSSTRAFKELGNNKELMRQAQEYVVGHDKTFKQTKSEHSARILAPAIQRSYVEASHTLAIECFLKAERHLDKKLLRDSILRLCISPEAFFVLRRQFVSSYSTMCITNYLLGIGDRHPDNILLDQTSATAVGIDFGHAFGTGIYIPCPELMPFRLTQQILHIMDPVGVHGQFEGTMISCLRVLRENRYILLNSMNVFVNEPSIDWMKEAKKGLKLEDDGEYSMASYISSIVPKKLEAAQRKLDGDNPVLILETELKRVAKPQYSQEKAIEVIYGKRDENPVSKSDQQHPRGYALTDLSVEEQVHCLIEMATDPLILARTWVGWCPWA